MARRVAGPRHPRAGDQNADIGLGATGNLDALYVVARPQVTLEFLRLGDCGRQPDASVAGRQCGETGEPERQLVAALGAGERMELVDDDKAQLAEQAGRVLIGNQQREGFRCRQQDVRGIATLTLAARRRRVAGARLQPDRQTHVRYRRFQVAFDVDRQRLQWRDVERVQPLARRAAGQIDQAGQKAGQRLAAAGRRDQET